MATDSATGIEDAIGSIFADFNHSPKEEQIAAISKLVNGKSVTCILPTGYGKSHVYMLLPLVLDKVSTNIMFLYFILLVITH